MTAMIKFIKITLRAKAPEIQITHLRIIRGSPPESES